MYFRLAVKNVKKSFRDYMIYFLTLAFAICLFYSFNSFQAQQAVMELSQSQHEIIESVQGLIKTLSMFVAVVLGFLIIYANNFLIKRRKKELGLYTLLGMPKHHISRVLVYETFMIGLLSLIAGLLAGLFVSQLLTIITANLFEAALNYSFIFSTDATKMTIIAFAMIFFIIMIFNIFILNRYQLIDLLTADKKNETLKGKNIYLSILMFLLSLVILGFTYWYALSEGMNALMQLQIIAPAGIIGTILFFMALSGFLLKFVQSSKKLYYRKLNMFVLRQINASINSNFVSMSIVCIMLLFSIGALATGTNLNRTINSTIQLATPFDCSYGVYDSAYNDKDYLIDLSNLKEDLKIDNRDIQEEYFIHDYRSDITFASFKPYVDDSVVPDDQFEEEFEVIPLSEMNIMRKVYGLEPLTLKPGEALMFTSSELIRDVVDGIVVEQPTFTLYGHSLRLRGERPEMINLGTTLNTSTTLIGVCVADELIPADAELYSMYWNVNLKDGVDQEQFSEMVNQRVSEYNKTNDGEESKQYMPSASTSAQAVQENSKGLSVIMTYIGLYLGLIFLLASAVILALQQLSQATDNKHRYQILNKIGAEKRMISQSVFLQLSIYFFMPLLLAIVHSVVGIQVVNSIVVVFGKSDLFLSSLVTGGMILLIYGAYFLFTYFGYRHILEK